MWFSISFISTPQKKVRTLKDKQLILTHISLASHFWDIGKRCRPRSDTAERSGSTLFAHRNLYHKYDKNGMYTRHPLNEKWTRPVDKYGKDVG